MCSPYVRQVLSCLSERAIDESLKRRYHIEENIRTTVKRNLEKIKWVNDGCFINISSAPKLVCLMDTVILINIFYLDRPWFNLPEQKWPQELLGLCVAFIFLRQAKHLKQA